MSPKDDVSRINPQTDKAYAQYREADAKLRELFDKMAPLKTREAELRESIRLAQRSAPLDGPVLSSADQKTVRELLGDGDSSRQTEAELQTELRSVKDQLRLIELAADQQRERTDAARQAANKEIRARLVPAHQSLARAIVDRLKHLRQALLDEADFRAALDDKGIGWGAPLISAAIASLSSDNCWLINHWLREFERGEGRYIISV